jgi:hypothetical protein
MNVRELKKVLAQSIEMEEELYDFCVECLKKIYSEDAREMIIRFNESIDSFEYHGCIQSLECLDNNLQKYKQKIQEQNKKRDAEWITRNVSFLNDAEIEGQNAKSTSETKINV